MRHTLTHFLTLDDEMGFKDQRWERLKVRLAGQLKGPLSIGGCMSRSLDQATVTVWVP